MKLLGLPPRFGIYPTGLLEMDLPAHLIQTYIILYTLGWRTEYRTVQQSVEQLAELFSVIERKQIQTRGMRKRLQDLADAGLVERSKREGRWVTVLKLRHEAPAGSLDPDRVTWSGPTGTELVPHLDKSIIVVDQSVSQQQQDYSRTGTEVEENERLLMQMGLIGDVVKRLAAEERVTPEYLEAVMEFRAREAAQGRILGTGWVVKCVGEGWEIPEQQGGEPHDRYRYVQGRYKEFVRH